MAVLEVLPDTYTPTLAADIRDTLNANGGKVTDTLTSFFTLAGNHNPWSKNKIMHIPYKQGVATDAEKKTAGGGEPSVNRYGITLIGGYGTTPSIIYAVMRNAPEGFTYKLPTGGEASPYRLADFCGYYPAAASPISSIFNDEVELTPPTSPSLGGFDLTYFSRTNVDSEREITFGDLYPPTEHGTTGIIRNYKMCLYVVEIGNPNNTKTFYEKITGEWLYNNKGKSFYAMQFMSTTLRTNSSEIAAWSASWQFAMPFPIFTLTVGTESSGGSGSGGNEGVQGDIIVQMDSSYPVFNGPTYDKYAMVYAPFLLTIVGGNGSVRNFTVALYTDKSCALTTRVDGSLTAYDDLIDATGATRYSPMLTNKDKLTTLWLGIYFNGNLQFKRQVLMPKEEVTTAE